eukprot:7494751-Pyramimonas_sp.AAC.1
MVWNKLLTEAPRITAALHAGERAPANPFDMRLSPCAFAARPEDALRALASVGAALRAMDH